MAFINPKILNKYYNKILIKYEKEFEDYLKYFESQLINKSKLGKYIPIWNYYESIKNTDFALKYLFLTKNIAENINSLLNTSFTKKYPTFNQWKSAILKIIDLFEKNNNELIRCNYSSKMMIYCAQNIKVTEKNIKLLSNDEIAKLNMINNNNNIFSGGSLSEFVYDNEIINENVIKKESQNQNNEEQDKEPSNDIKIIYIIMKLMKII